MSSKLIHASMFLRFATLSIIALSVIATFPALARSPFDDMTDEEAAEKAVCLELPNGGLVLSLRPRLPRFSDIRRAQLVFTLKNTCQFTRWGLNLPNSTADPWRPEIVIHRNGEPLQRFTQYEYGYRPTALGPSEQLTLIVDVTKFFVEDAVAPPGAGKYEAVVFPGALGGQHDARAEFTIDPRLPAGADSLEGAVERHLPELGALPEADRRRRVWRSLLASPNDARWLEVLPQLTGDLVDASAALDLIETTTDVGVRREATRALALAGPNPAAAARLRELRKRISVKDGPFQNWRQDASYVLNARDGMGNPVFPTPNCSARDFGSKNCPLASHQCRWTKDEGWECEGGGKSR